MGAGINQLTYTGNAKSSSGSSAQETASCGLKRAGGRQFMSEKQFYIISENDIQTLELQHKILLSLGDNNKMFIMSS